VTWPQLLTIIKKRIKTNLRQNPHQNPLRLIESIDVFTHLDKLLEFTYSPLIKSNGTRLAALYKLKPPTVSELAR